MLVVSSVMRQMITKGKFSSAMRKTLNEVIEYLDCKKKFVRYYEFMAKGYPIGSGVVEGAFGHVVKNRMEDSGLR